MPTAYLICGKICSGKSYLARTLAREKNAVILSADEITTLFGADLGDQHDAVSRRVRQYLFQKAAEIIACGVSVILDWGFWSREMRGEAAAYFAARAIPTQWHYLDIADETWQARIDHRNAHLGQADYYVDAGLKQKCLTLFEKPDRQEIDVWHDIP
ncbi:MAG: ATP-binding protein [Clostridia bacterium]|nr:ATP-binding protein [Clostridia bacterium]